MFAATVDDAHAAFRAMAGYDSRDPFSRTVTCGPLGAMASTLRLGIPRVEDLFFDGDEASASAWVAALQVYKDLGARFVEVDLTPFFETAKLLYEGPYVAERYEAIRGFIEERPDALLPVTRKIISGATRFSAADAYAASYRLKELVRSTAGVWSGIDALVVPTLPRPYGVAELAADPIGPNSKLGTYTNFVNLLDLCALAVPGPFRGDGFPAGTTLIAPRGSDAAIASIGRTVHAAANVPLGATKSTIPALAKLPVRAEPGEFELCVVGAHLSGMPLNKELQALGARLLRAADTKESYRLYALPGGPPFKPGLLRVAEGGVAIETEVWALTPKAFGRFVAAIPSPLGIGTLNLADGTHPKGFLVEPEALTGAKDVSNHGGWRAYMASRG